MKNSILWQSIILPKITENSLAQINFYCNMIKMINCSTSKVKTYFKLISLVLKKNKLRFRFT